MPATACRKPRPYRCILSMKSSGAAGRSPRACATKTSISAAPAGRPGLDAPPTPASRAADNLRSSRRNKTRVWLPGAGAIYGLNDRLTLFGGVHKGFTAPTNAPGVDEETALNVEAGARFNGERLSAEATWFLSDYDNLLGECTASSGADCEIGDAFNGDAATVTGLELRLVADLLPDAAVSLPLELAYTYINGEFDTDIADTDFFGDVRKGDPIPYIPDHQLNLTPRPAADPLGVVPIRQLYRRGLHEGGLRRLRAHRQHVDPRLRRQLPPDRQPRPLCPSGKPEPASRRSSAVNPTAPGPTRTAPHRLACASPSDLVHRLRDVGGAEFGASQTPTNPRQRVRTRISGFAIAFARLIRDAIAPGSGSAVVQRRATRQWFHRPD